MANFVTKQDWLKFKQSKRDEGRPKFFKVPPGETVTVRFLPPLPPTWEAARQAVIDANGTDCVLRAAGVPVRRHD